MLKTISKDEVRLGMFIHALEGPWITHPFWRRRFLLQDERDLEALLSSGVTSLVIDTAKGLAPMSGKEPRSPSGEESDGGSGPSADKRPTRFPQRRSAPEPALKLVRCELAAEMTRAATVLRQSRGAAQELLLSDPRGVDGALPSLRPTLAEISASVTRNGSALISLARERPEHAPAASKAVSLSALMVNLARQLGFNAQAIEAAGYVGFRSGLQTLLAEGESPGLSAETQRRASDVLRDARSRSDGWRPAGEDLEKLSSKERAILFGMNLVCEVYDTMTSVGAARKAINPAEAVSHLYRLKDHFEESLLNRFIRSIGIFPAGSLVQLETSRLAVVADQDSESLINPTVLQFFCATRREWIPLDQVRLAGSKTRILSREDPQKWGFADFGRDWVPLIVEGRRPALVAPSERTRSGFAGS